MQIPKLLHFSDSDPKLWQSCSRSNGTPGWYVSRVGVTIAMTGQKYFGTQRRTKTQIQWDQTPKKHLNLPLVFGFLSLNKPLVKLSLLSQSYIRQKMLVRLSVHIHVGTFRGPPLDTETGFSVKDLISKLAKKKDSIVKICSLFCSYLFRFIYIFLVLKSFKYFFFFLNI